MFHSQVQQDSDADFMSEGLLTVTEIIVRLFRTWILEKHEEFYNYFNNKAMPLFWQK